MQRSLFALSGPLENKFQRKLDIARRVERVSCCNPAEVAGICWNTGCIKPTEDIPRHSEQWRVADVERLDAELELRVFLNREVLEYRQVNAFVRRHGEHVMSFGTHRPKGLPPEL